MIALTERAERRRAASTRSTRSETIESYPSTGLEDFRGGIRFADTGSLSVTKISAFYFPSFSDSLLFLKSTAGAFDIATCDIKEARFSAESTKGRIVSFIGR